MARLTSDTGEPFVNGKRVTKPNDVDHSFLTANAPPSASLGPGSDMRTLCKDIPPFEKKPSSSSGTAQSLEKDAVGNGLIKFDEVVNFETNPPVTSILGNDDSSENFQQQLTEDHPSGITNSLKIIPTAKSQITNSPCSPTVFGHSSACCSQELQRLTKLRTSLETERQDFDQKLLEINKRTKSLLEQEASLLDREHHFETKERQLHEKLVNLELRQRYLSEKEIVLEGKILQLGEASRKVKFKQEDVFQQQQSLKILDDTLKRQQSDIDEKMLEISERTNEVRTKEKYLKALECSLEEREHYLESKVEQVLEHEQASTHGQSGMTLQARKSHNKSQELDLKKRELEVQEENFESLRRNTQNCIAEVEEENTILDHQEREEKLHNKVEIIYNSVMTPPTGDNFDPVAFESGISREKESKHGDNFFNSTPLKEALKIREVIPLETSGLLADIQETNISTFEANNRFPKEKFYFSDQKKSLAHKEGELNAIELKLKNTMQEQEETKERFDKRSHNFNNLQEIAVQRNEHLPRGLHEVDHRLDELESSQNSFACQKEEVPIHEQKMKVRLMDLADQEKKVQKAELSLSEANRDLEACIQVINYNPAIMQNKLEKNEDLSRYTNSKLSTLVTQFTTLEPKHTQQKMDGEVLEMLYFTQSDLMNTASSNKPDASLFHLPPANSEMNILLASSCSQEATRLSNSTDPSFCVKKELFTTPEYSFTTKQYSLASSISASCDSHSSMRHMTTGGIASACPPMQNVSLTSLVEPNATQQILNLSFNSESESAQQQTEPQPTTCSELCTVSISKTIMAPDQLSTPEGEFDS
ncbi:unnamed protein product [Protopolystoma xenopodis]|uniref:Uncharacterized protein n=1 Tax=Protopolystoma xenopodis TaxID=117903 RepID=A0A448XBG5_9PLAT|nr:unnamed protein product [Protopolystoma xenopodis]